MHVQHHKHSYICKVYLLLHQSYGPSVCMLYLCLPTMLLGPGNA